MEKRGVIAPDVTPPEHTDTLRQADSAKAIKIAAADSPAVIEALDGDFRKTAAEATRKSLR
jgi:hypothetical protein